jgi:hypothetical protein
MAKKSIQIEIDEDDGKIVAHVEGYKSKLECKKEIMDLIEGIVDVVEGGYTIDIRPKGGQKVKRTQKKKQRETN